MQKIVACLCFVASLSVPGFGLGDTLLQTANLPVTHVQSGTSGTGLSILDVQYIAARFHLSQTTQIDEIGGAALEITNTHDSQSGNLELFGAIVQISGPTGFPGQVPENFQPLAETLIAPALSSTSGDTLVPLPITLPAGDYALVFGSGRFGATGRGDLAYMSGDTAQASFIVGAFPTHDTSNWQDSDDVGGDNVRFVITGSPVPEPGSLALALVGLAAVACHRQSWTVLASLVGLS